MTQFVKFEPADFFPNQKFHETSKSVLKSFEAHAREKLQQKPPHH